MPVNLEAWNDTIEHLRRRLQSAEVHLAQLSTSVIEQDRAVNALRDQLKHLEQLDKDLTDLLAARGEARS